MLLFNNEVMWLKMEFMGSTCFRPPVMALWVNLADLIVKKVKWNLNLICHSSFKLVRCSYFHC